MERRADDYGLQMIAQLGTWMVERLVEEHSRNTLKRRRSQLTNTRLVGEFDFFSSSGIFLPLWMDLSF